MWDISRRGEQEREREKGNTGAAACCSWLLLLVAILAGVAGEGGL